MSSASKLFTILAAASLLAATMLGAYASHAPGLEPRALATVQTAVQYQFYHGLGLLAVALLGERVGGRTVRVAGALLFAGIVLFCGGIYASVLLGWSAFSSVTPFGGASFIAGWVAVIVAAARTRAAGS